MPYAHLRYSSHTFCKLQSHIQCTASPGETVYVSQVSNWDIETLKEHLQGMPDKWNPLIVDVIAIQNNVTS